MGVNKLTDWTKRQVEKSGNVNITKKKKTLIIYYHCRIKTGQTRSVRIKPNKNQRSFQCKINIQRFSNELLIGQQQRFIVMSSQNQNVHFYYAINIFFHISVKFVA